MANRVILRVKTTSDTLDITCDGIDAFKVSDPQGSKSGQDVLNTKMMVRRVLEWWEKLGREGIGAERAVFVSRLCRHG